MVSKRLVVALGFALSIAAPLAFAEGEGEGGHPAEESSNTAKISIGKTAAGRNWGENAGNYRDNLKWRKDFGSFKGIHESKHIQEPETGSKRQVDLIGIKTKEYHAFGTDDKDRKEAHNGCEAAWSALAAQGGANIGLVKNESSEFNDKHKVKMPNLTCSAGVEGTVIGGGVDCQKQLAGDSNLGVDVKGGASGGVKAVAKCSCDGAAVICELFAGVKGSLDGTIGGSLCGLRLGLGGGVEGGAGAGGRAAAGYRPGKGFGFSVAGYVGLGVGASLYVDPDISALWNDTGKTTTCLKERLLNPIRSLFARITLPQPAAKPQGGATFLKK